METRRKMAIEERVCCICGKNELTADIVPAALVRPAVAKLIKEKCPEWPTSCWICTDDLDRYRNDYVRSLLELERGELSSMEQEVLDNLRTHELFCPIMSRKPLNRASRSVSAFLIRSRLLEGVGGLF